MTYPPQGPQQPYDPRQQASGPPYGQQPQYGQQPGYGQEQAYPQQPASGAPYAQQPYSAPPGQQQSYGGPPPPQNQFPPPAYGGPGPAMGQQPGDVARPPQALMAAVLMFAIALIALIGLVGTLRNLGWVTVGGFDIVLWIIVLPAITGLLQLVSGVLGIGVAKGKQAARGAAFLTVGLALVIGLVGFFLPRIMYNGLSYMFNDAFSTISIILWLLSLIVQIGILILLALPAVGRWFRAQNSLPPPSLPGQGQPFGPSAPNNPPHWP